MDIKPRTAIGLGEIPTKDFQFKQWYGKINCRDIHNLDTVAFILINSITYDIIDRENLQRYAESIVFSYLN